jgi:hypothetical protein
VTFRRAKDSATCSDRVRSVAVAFLVVVGGGAFGEASASCVAHKRQQYGG